MSNAGNNLRTTAIHRAVEELCAPESYASVAHRSNLDMPMPTVETLAEIVQSLRAVLFPGYFGHAELVPQTLRYYAGATLDRVFELLAEQIKRGLCFLCPVGQDPNCAECERRAGRIVADFILRLPEVRRLLAADVRAAYGGDPAAKSPGEAIFCYPSVKALTNYRLAHVLHQAEVPLIPRIITELAHSETGIDIHPGARIAGSFFMDHGTGIVIGETCVIGSNVRIYQGVTLGAQSFPLDAAGKPVKGIPRHPIVGDDVIIYSGATILGRVRIGKGAVIGGNVWVTEDVPPGSRVIQTKR